MNQADRRRYLIEELLRERPSCRRQEIPADADRQKVLLRSLMNVRHPGAISDMYSGGFYPFATPEESYKRLIFPNGNFCHLTVTMRR